MKSIVVRLDLLVRIWSTLYDDDDKPNNFFKIRRMINQTIVFG